MKLNWALFGLVAWILFGMELGLRPVLEVGSTGIAPSFVFPLLVFVALSAPAATARWAALVLGLATDLTNVVPTAEGGSPLTVIGPYALGYLVGAQLVLSLRSMMIRRNPLTLGLLSVLAMLGAQIVVVFMFTLRSLLGDPIVWESLPELGSRMGTALVTGLSGLLLAFVLNPLGAAMGIHAQQQRRFARRAG